MYYIATQLQSLLTPLEIPQISPSATSSELSDEASYPYFFRTAPPDGQQAAFIAAVLVAYGNNLISATIVSPSS